MRILLAGTVHANAWCRRELLRLLQDLKSSETKAPVFIAVEGDAGLFEQIRAQRTAFIGRAREAWPSEISDDLINELALAMLFEADAHRAVFRDTEAIWMERDRELREPESVSQYGDAHFMWCDRWIQLRRASGGDLSTLSILRYLSDASKLGVRDGPPCRDSARDARWYEEVRPFLSQSEDDSWAVVICGVEHTLVEKGNIAELLTLDGHDVQGIDLVRAL